MFSKLLTHLTNPEAEVLCVEPRQFGVDDGHPPLPKPHPTDSNPAGLHSHGDSTRRAARTARVFGLFRHLGSFHASCFGGCKWVKVPVHGVAAAGALAARDGREDD